jgi:hypothetical protein
LALFGASEDEIKEAGWAAKVTVGLSAYFYGIGFSKEQYGKDLDKIVKHIKQSAQG